MSGIERNVPAGDAVKRGAWGHGGVSHTQYPHTAKPSKIVSSTYLTPSEILSV